MSRKVKALFLYLVIGGFTAGRFRRWSKENPDPEFSKTEEVAVTVLTALAWPAVAYRFVRAWLKLIS